LFLARASSFFSSHARSSAARAFAALVDDMRSKTDQIRTAWFRGDRIAALRIAARFFDLSEGTIAFKCGISAFNHPDFYRQIGKEPQELVSAALALLAKRFDLH
jgi:hypothetical protein